MNHENCELSIGELDVVCGGEHSVAYLAGWLTETVVIVAQGVYGAAKGAASTIANGVG